MKHALVTSATRSQGKVFAKTLARNGYELVLHYNSNKTLADELAKELGATLVQADLGSEDGVSALLKQLLAQPKLDVIINNAGTDEEIDNKDISAWHKVLSINTITPALIMGNAEELINKDGVIINISSAFGNEMSGDKDLAAYDASKAAVNSLTRTFAKRLAPGYVRSRWNEGYSLDDLERIKKQQLIERLIEPQEVADLMMHVVNNNAFDGEVIYLDGGLNLKTI